MTVWTASGSTGAPAGITVSSVLVAEGDPPEMLGLVDPLCAFWDAANESGSFLVHVLATDQVRTAEKFALHLPGDPFEGEEVTRTAWGPGIGAVPARAGCTLTGSTEVGYGLLVRGRIDEVLIDERTVAPLVHYRGAYRALTNLRP